MARLSISGLFFALLLALNSSAQISPGDLTTSHADLEGMSNCTKCHVLGEKVSNDKCLDCHKEISSLIDQKRGYHSSAEVRNKDCFACHSEHHGRKFEMIRFDEDGFDHGKTGYTLKGEHKVIDCRECHAPEHIRTPDLKKRKNTFLGLDKECLSCHDDQHQETLSKDCLSCHDMKGFSPAPNFDHADTDFQLVGEHIEIECKECHKISTKNGREFQYFADVPHNDCSECHSDPHAGHFAGTCTQCHTETSFSQFAGTNSFDHGSTEFALRGAHVSVSCFECHQQNSDPLLVFQDRSGILVDQCATCHEDEHEGKFGTDCAQCHEEESFLALKSMEFFDHNVTDFPLEGKHMGVDCKECHEGRYSEPLDFSACKNCHEDYHKGEFEKDGATPDCSQCHALDNGFDITLFTLEHHSRSEFPLEGAHLATPCFECHLSENQWTFRNIGTNCVDCHDDAHNDGFALNGVTDCERCHITDTWVPSRFDHNTTNFPLDGRHAEIDCRECHKNEVVNGKSVVIYKIEKFECIDCHQ